MQKPAVKKQKEPPVSSPATSSHPASTMEELLVQTGYEIKGFKRGDIISGTVLSVSAHQLLLDIGGKGEGVVHEKEMPHIIDLVKNLKIGDTISVHVVSFPAQPARAR